MLSKSPKPLQECEEEVPLSYQLKKIFHLVELQTLDLESTLQYIQKKQTVSQLKQVFAHAYSIFNETEPIYRSLKAKYLYEHFKRLISCFGIIYLILTEKLDKSTNATVEKTETVSDSNSTLTLTQRRNQLSNGDGVLTQPQKVNFLGGVHLYNQNYLRSIEGDVDRVQHKRKNEPVVVKSQKEKLKAEILKQLDENYLAGVMSPQEMMNQLGMKQQAAEAIQVVNLQEELEAIAQFFKESQDEAFHFLSKAKDEGQYISYVEDFKEVMDVFKKEKEGNIQDCIGKIKVAFHSMKLKADKKLSAITTKLEELLELKRKMMATERKEKDTQTITNFDVEIDSLRKTIQDLERNYHYLAETRREENQKTNKQIADLEHTVHSNTKVINHLQSEMAAKQTQIDQLNQKLKDRTTDWDKEGNRLDENTKRRKGNADSRVRLRQTHKGSNLGSIVDNLATDPKEVTQQSIEQLRRSSGIEETHQGNDFPRQHRRSVKMSQKKMKTQSEEQAFKSASTTLDNKYKRYFESEVAEHGNQVPMSSFSPTGSLFQQKANENHLEIVHQGGVNNSPIVKQISNKPQQVTTFDKIKQQNPALQTGKERQRADNVLVQESEEAYLQSESKEAIQRGNLRKNIKLQKDINQSYPQKLAQNHTPNIKRVITYQHFETQQESGQDTVIRQSSSKKSLRSNRAIKPDKIYKLGENSYHKKIERQISFAPLIDDNAQIVDKLDGENSQKDTQRSYQPGKYKSNLRSGQAYSTQQERTEGEDHCCLCSGTINMVITPTVRGTEAIKIDSADKKNAIAKVAMKSINSTSSAEKAGHRDQPSKKTRFQVALGDQNQSTEDNVREQKIKQNLQQNRQYNRQEQALIVIRSSSPRICPLLEAGHPLDEAVESDKLEAIVGSENNLRKISAHCLKKNSFLYKTNDSLRRNQVQTKQQNNSFVAKSLFQKQAIALAKQCRDIEEYKRKLAPLHSTCGSFCSHLLKYFSNFAKYRGNKEGIKLHIENVHCNIRDEKKDIVLLPILNQHK